MSKARVAAYCRVSTDSLDQLNSLRNQRDYFEQYCGDKSLELVNLYADEGITGTSWRKRDDFIRMLKDAGLNVVYGQREIHLETSDRAPKFERILIKDVSRFARNAGNAAEIIERLRHKGVHIDFVTANLSTDQLSADVLLKIMAVLAEAESRDRAVKGIFGQRAGAERGIIKTADILFGYRYIKEENDLEIVPEEAEVIRLMFDLYVDGYGFRRIINELNARGITTRKGKPFAQQSIRRMLCNPTYKGLLVRNRLAKSVFDGRATAVIRPESEWYSHEGRIPAIVDEDIWAQAQQVKQKKVHSEQRRGVKVAMTPYAGKIVCGKCGANYLKNRESRTGRDFFVCKTKKKFGVAACGSRNVGLDEIEAILQRASRTDVQRLFERRKKDMITTITSIYVDTQLKPRMNRKDDESVQNKRVELAELHDQKRRLADIYLVGGFDADFLTSKAEEIDTDIETVEEQLAYLSKSNADIGREIEEIQKVAEQIEQLQYEEKDLMRIVKKISVNALDGRAPLMLTYSFNDVLSRVETAGISKDFSAFVKLIQDRDGGIVTL